MSAKVSNTDHGYSWVTQQSICGSNSEKERVEELTMAIYEKKCHETEEAFAVTALQEVYIKSTCLLLG